MAVKRKAPQIRRSRKAIAAIVPSPAYAVKAVKELKRAGLPLDQIVVATRDRSTRLEFINKVGSDQVKSRVTTDLVAFGTKHGLSDVTPKLARIKPQFTTGTVFIKVEQAKPGIGIVRGTIQRNSGLARKTMMFSLLPGGIGTPPPGPPIPKPSRSR